MMKTLPKLLAVLSICGVMASGGCGEEDEVRRYRIPPLAEADDLPAFQREPAAAQPAGGGAGGDHTHTHAHEHGPPWMIVAIMPHEGQNWFFRMLGPAADMPAELQHFSDFLRSVRFEEGGPRFEAPEHWQELEATGLRYAAFRCGHAGHPIELTVVPLGANAGTLLDNVNRWRGQLNLPPIGEAGLSEMVTRHELSGREVVMVYIGGEREAQAAAGRSATPGAARGGAGGAAPASGADEGPQVRYDVPPGWQEQEATSAMRRASLAIMDGQRMLADVSVIPLVGDGGGLLANVNRWRGQVGLEPIDEQELEAALLPVTIDGGREAVYVDLVGEGGPDGEPMRILSAIHQRGEMTWFIKMTGEVETLGQQKEAFERFVESIRFEGDGGEA